MLSALAFAASLAAQDVRDRADEILARHLAFLGGREALDEAQDWQAEGTYSRQGIDVGYRLLVRREPLAVREEFIVPGGKAPPFVLVSDGWKAWQIDARGGSHALPGAQARIAIENAFLWSLAYLRRESCEQATFEATPLEGWPGLPEGFESEPRVRGLVVRTSLGSLWELLFDERDGRLHGARDFVARPARWLRFGDWKDLGNVTFATRVVDGLPGSGHGELRLVSVCTGLAHDPALFAGGANPPLAGVVDVGPLTPVRAAVPGSGYLLLPDVRINADLRVVALLDTGAAVVAIHPVVAGWVGAPILAPDSILGAAGMVQTEARWIDSLEFARLRLVQVHALSIAIVRIDDFACEFVPGLVFGGRELFENSPVLDLDSGRLLFRGRPVVPLGEIPPRGQADRKEERRILRVPYVRTAPFAPPLVEIAVEGRADKATVFLDSGSPYALRLFARGLRKLGLSSRREVWMERGAYPYAFGGAGGTASSDLLVRLDALELGPLVFRRPWVLLAGMGTEDGPLDVDMEGMLGGGALLPFARIALDDQRRVLELEDRGGLVKGEGGHLEVPDPGQFLGFTLAAPERRAVAEPDTLPVITDVLPGTPAQRAGLLRGDRLLAIDGLSCARQAPTMFQRSLWVREDRRVVLLVARAGTPELLSFDLP